MPIQGTVPSEILEGPAAIRATLDTTESSVGAVASDLRARGIRRIWVIGNGTSYHSSLHAAGLARRLAGPGDPITIPVTAGDFRTFRPRLGPGDAIVGISASGEFRDVLGVFEEVRGTIPTVGIVHVPGSSLTRIADHVVLSAGGTSAAPVMTKTFSSTLVGDDPRAGGDPRRRTPGDGRRRPPSRGRPRRDGDRRRLAARRVARRRDRRRGAPLRRRRRPRLPGRARGGAQAQGDGARPRGGVRDLGDGVRARDDGRSRDRGRVAGARWSRARRDRRRRPRTAASGAPGSSRSPRAARSRTPASWPFPGGVDERFAPLTVVPPVALLAYVLAGLRGATPDQPSWTERYHSQGLTHIVGV